jgi:hypothetical protein
VLDGLILWLDQVRSAVFWACLTGLVVLDVGAVAAVVATRSRALVNRWTGAVLAANLILLGAGVGVPVVAYAAKAVASALAPSLSTLSTKSDAAPAAVPASTAP